MLDPAPLLARGVLGLLPEPLQGVWIDLRTAMRDVLEQTTLADLVARGQPQA